MASSISLGELVDAIANALIEAQDSVEKHQVALLRGYLDEDSRPKTLKFRVPSLRDGAGHFDEDELEVPVLALVGASRLAIKEMEISTDVALSDLERVAARPEADPAPGLPVALPGAPAEPASSTASAPNRPRLNLDLAGSNKNPASATAKMVLKVEALEPSEGIARLMIELNKRMRMYPTPSQ